MADYGFKAGIRRELRRLGSRPAYLLGMFGIPLFVAFFFVTILGEGLPQQIPTAIVDLDQSTMSRQVVRTISASQLVSVRNDVESYDDALRLVREGEIYGFFVIPANFKRDALSMRTPTLEYYTNMTYYIPGTLAFKGFKTVAVTTSGGVVKNTLIAVGMDPQQIDGLLQPVVIDINPLNNPWMNYSIYMAPSFTMATVVLMIMIITVFSITGEIKHGTSRAWLRTCRGRLGIALLSKLLPQSAIWCSVVLFISWMFFGWQHFPVNGSLWWMLLATFLLVFAVQGFTVFIVSVVPNPRMSFIVVALFGVLSYSFTGFSMPVPSMYGYIGVFSWLAPVRYWYLIFVDNALNGVPVYYSRWFFVALLGFCLLPLLLLPRLSKALRHPVYVP